MKKLTAKFKQEILTKKGAIKSRYASALSYQRDGIFYPYRWTRSGGHFTLIDKYQQITTVLDLAGYKYTFGNDSPRRGLEWAYIRVSAPAMTFIQSLLNRQ